MDKWVNINITCICWLTKNATKKIISSTSYLRYPSKWPFKSGTKMKKRNSKRRQYASFPLWVIIHLWGIKGVWLHKRWDKCYRWCIDSLFSLASIEWISTFYYVIDDLVSAIIHLKKNTEIILNLSIPCFFKVGLILK